MSQSDSAPETPAGGVPLSGTAPNSPASEYSAAPDREIIQGPPGSPASSGVPNWRGRKLPLPGFVKIYLASLYITIAAVAVMLVVSLFQLSRAWYIPPVAFLLLAVIVGLGLLVLTNILRIHDRNPGAPSFSRGFLMVTGILLAGLYLFYIYTLFESRRYGWGSSALVKSQDIVAALLNLLYVVAWYLYWKRSPRVREVFRETGGDAVDASPAGVHLSRLAAMSVCFAGIGSFVGALTMDNDGFPWMSLCFLAVWALLGVWIFLFASPAAFRAERSFSALLAGMVVLWLFNLAHALAMGGFFSEGPMHAELAYFMVPKAYVSTVMICMLCYAGWCALQPENFPERLAGLLGGVRDAFRSGVSYVELGGLLAVAYYLFNLLPNYARGEDVRKLFQAFTDGSFSEVPWHVFGYALAVACALAIVFGGLVALWKAPARLTGLLRIFVPVMLACFAFFIFAPVYTEIAGKGFTAEIAIRMERWLLHLPLVLGMLTVYLWRREAVLGSGRPAPVAMVRAVSWYFAIKLVFFVLAFAINPHVPHGGGYLLSAFTGLSFRVGWLFASADWVLGILGVGMLVSTAQAATASLSRLMGWGIAFVAVTVLGTVVLEGVSALVASDFWNFVRQVESGRFGNPWLRPLPVGFAVFLLMCSSWERVRSWFADARRGEGA